MESLNHEDPFTQQIAHQWKNDWAFQNSTQTQIIDFKSQNMLFNLSNNLLSYQNSYKKNIIKKSIHSEATQCIRKRKIKRKKIHFQNLENQQPNHQDSHQHQNNHQRQNHTTCTSDLKHHESQRKNSNIKKLSQMFKILQQFDTLNDSILPFKVNLNKISQKRILANMILKDSISNKENFPSLNQQTQTSLNVHNFQFKKNTFEGDYVPVKSRLYSLNFKNDQRYQKSQKASSQKFLNPIHNNQFSVEKDQNLSRQKRSASFSKRKRTYSFRKPQNYANQKTIEEICQNYERFQKQEKFQQLKSQPNIKRNTMKVGENFSDERFLRGKNILKQLKVGDLRNILRR